MDAQDVFVVREAGAAVPVQGLSLSHASAFSAPQSPDQDSCSVHLSGAARFLCRWAGRKGQYGLCPRPSPCFAFSLQTEGTRLQKDLRTYLASVKGKVQVGLLGRPGLGRRLRGTVRGSFPHAADGC